MAIVPLASALARPMSEEHDLLGIENAKEKLESTNLLNLSGQSPRFGDQIGAVVWATLNTVFP